GERVKDARHLKFDAQAPLYSGVRFQRRDVLTVEQDRARQGCVGTENQFEQCALAGAVRSDHAPNLSGGDVEVHAVGSEQATERFLQAAGIEQVLRSRHDLPRAAPAARRLSLTPSAFTADTTKPPGAHSTTVSRMPPIRICAYWLPY